MFSISLTEANSCRTE